MANTDSREAKRQWLGVVRATVRVMACAMSLGALLSQSNAADFLLSDFNSDPFNSTFGGFSQTSGPQKTRLTDNADGQGGAIEVESFDLSTFANGRFVVDFTPLPNNGVDFFQLELTDSNNLNGRWQVNVGGLTPNVPVSLTTLNDLNTPDDVFDLNTFQFVQDLPDLSQIVDWRIEGQFGSPQPFDIEFDNLIVSTTVGQPPPYEGFEPNAPWRADAVTRIDQNRKANLAVRVMTASGQPVSGAQVTVAMQEHEYKFGSALEASRLVSNTTENQAYKQKAAELFNATTLFNALKWPAWEGDWGPSFTHQKATDALDWAANNGMTARGHTMVWPSIHGLPNFMDAKLNEYNAPGTTPARKVQLEQEMRQAALDHIADIGAVTEGKVVDWDVINEIRDNHELMDIMGDSVMVDWFNAASSGNPSSKLFINEFDILAASGNTDSANQQVLFDKVDFLINNGAPIDGIGLQSHFDDGRLTGPEQIWEILDRFDTLGLGIKITEFTHETDDSDLKAQFMHDFLTAVFAHEATDEFILWGFSALDIGLKGVLFDENFDPLPNGQAFLDLVYGEWWTDEQGTTDPNGVYSERVFRGAHDITVDYLGNTWQAQQQVGANGLEWVVVVSDPGDFDLDGDVDGLDFLAWQRGESPSPFSASDLADWETNYGTVALTAAVAAVPEPATVLLLLAGVVFPVRKSVISNSSVS